MLLEIEISSLRVLMKSDLEEVEWMKIRYEQLHMINEKRLVAICHYKLYQKRMAKTHDKKISSLRVLMKSDLEEVEWMKIRYEQLNMISEKRLVAIFHYQLYQKRMAKTHDKKV
jgi:hypothetical protein